jgi:pimeloyl-ACP methyl ester carboxylesterase
MKKTSNTKTKKSRKVAKTIGMIVASLVALPLITLFIFRCICAPIERGTHKIDTANGIDQMELVEIGGIQQCLYFRGENKDNPAILFLHGGPGTANIPMISLYQYGWERDFTVVNWDQRNSGKTYIANKVDPESMSIDQAVEDAHQVTQYIKTKLGKEKIVVLGHSWGTLLGSILIQQYPEDYSMDIGTGNVTNNTDSERLAYEKVMQEAKAAGNQKDIDALEALVFYVACFMQNLFLWKILFLNKSNSISSLSNL